MDCSAADRVYTERRRALISAFAERGIVAFGRSGMNVWVPVPDEASAASALLEAGFAVSAGARFRIQSGPALRITTATLRAENAGRVADALANALRPSGRSLSV